MCASKGFLGGGVFAEQAPGFARIISHAQSFAEFAVCRRPSRVPGASTLPLQIPAALQDLQRVVMIRHAQRLGAFEPAQCDLPGRGFPGGLVGTSPAILAPAFVRIVWGQQRPAVVPNLRGKVENNRRRREQQSIFIAERNKYLVPGAFSKLLTLQKAINHETIYYPSRDR